MSRAPKHNNTMCHSAWLFLCTLWFLIHITHNFRFQFGDLRTITFMFATIAAATTTAATTSMMMMMTPKIAIRYCLWALAKYFSPFQNIENFVFRFSIYIYSVWFDIQDVFKRLPLNINVECECVSMITIIIIIIRVELMLALSKTTR